MKNIVRSLFALMLVAMLTACGHQVEIPPAHVGKIMTKDGYQKGTIGSSKFRLAPCMNYCDKLVLLNTSDTAKEEEMNIFIPTDKLNLTVGLRVTLSLDPRETEALFNTLSPTASADDPQRLASISWDQVYNTYAQQVILTETREYLSKYSIAQIASSMEKVNSDLRIILSKKLQERTPFNVRYVGVTRVRYPEIITSAQENAAQRREQIQQEEAQLAISQVKLNRQLQEAQLQRQIDLEKAEGEAKAQAALSRTVDAQVLELRRIDNQAAFIEKWDGKLPDTLAGESANILMQLQGK
jgi:predicted small lipoprotein YifL/regulator of protease activity HflC (stomatin/prohibitin superfamily)